MVGTPQSIGFWNGDWNDGPFPIGFDDLPQMPMGFLGCPQPRRGPWWVQVAAVVPQRASGLRWRSHLRNALELENWRFAINCKTIGKPWENGGFPWDLMGCISGELENWRIGDFDMAELDVPLQTIQLLMCIPIDGNLQIYTYNPNRSGEITLIHSPAFRWLEAIWRWFPLLANDSQWGRNEVVII